MTIRPRQMPYLLVIVTAVLAISLLFAISVLAGSNGPVGVANTNNGNIQRTNFNQAHPNYILSSTFTYQGLLTDGGGPANGSYDLQFELYDDATAGVQVGITLVNENVLVNDGLFTLGLDFGTVFDGQPLWLEIGVRPGNDPGPFTILLPRQPVTPAPYAYYAETTPWDGLLNIPAGFLDGIDNDTMYTAGTGLFLNTNDFNLEQSYSLPQGCGSGEVPSWNGSGWDCSSAGGGAAWLLSGNVGTTAGTNFLGTTDNEPLEIHVNGQRVFLFDPQAISPNILGGYSGNYATGVYGATIGGGGQSGAENGVLALYGTVSGGAGNVVSGDYASVAGGWANYATGWESAIGGGGVNQANGSDATVAGGFSNSANSDYSAVGGGEWNVVGGNHGVIAGGQQNHISTSTLASIGGGYQNQVMTNTGTIGGGAFNQVLGIEGMIGGGSFNTAKGNRAVIGGGFGNYADGNTVTIAGGEVISVTADYAAVGGGQNNMITGNYGSVGGGQNNVLTGTFGTIGGGGYNAARGNFATVAGGNTNVANAPGATISGGIFNSAVGANSVVPGGYFNIASGDQSFAAGCAARADHAGSFVWADAFNCNPVTSQRDNQFRIQAYGGLYLDDEVGNYIDMLWSQPIDTSTGAYLSWGGVWTNASDVNLKENFETVNGRQILQTLANVPIQSWNYIAEADDIRHLGPTAQEFYAAFALGDTDTAIGTVDADGVALAAIQGLYEINQEQTAQIEQLQAQNDELDARLDALEMAVQSRGGTASGFGWLPLLGFLAVGVVFGRRRFEGGGQ